MNRLEQPAYALHALVAVLDRSADEILKDRFGITFSRYLTLLTLQRLGSATQRELAAELSVSEPSISRTVPLLTGAGYLTATSVAGGGNRRRLELTAVGEKLVDEAAEALEEAFGQVLDLAGVPPEQVIAITGPMLRVLGAGPDDDGMSS